MTVYEVTRQLPEIRVVKNRAQALAMLDAIMCEEPSLRYYSFDSSWSTTEMLASMADGTGNDYSVVFSPVGAFARGFDHESPMTPFARNPLQTWPGLIDSVPEAFHHLLTEPAFCKDGIFNATVCFWREFSDTSWNSGKVDLPDSEYADVDGANWLFEILGTGTAESYRDFANGYYETTPDLTAIQHILDHKPLTQTVVTLLNPDRRLEDLHDDLAQNGYGRD